MDNIIKDECRKRIYIRQLRLYIEIYYEQLLQTL